MTDVLPVLAVPLHLGRAGVAVGCGPRWLVDQSKWLRIDHVVSEPVGAPENEPARSLAALGPVRDWVAGQHAAGRLPVVLAGNCHTTVGVIAGAGDVDPQVLWLDAHADFHTSATTRSGFLDGQALAVLVGHEWTTLARAQGLRPVAERDVHLVGPRDVEHAERERLADSQVREPKVNEHRWLRDGDRPVHVHLDLDVLHSDLGAVNDHGCVPGGVRPHELLGLLRAVAAERPVCSVTVASCDPNYATEEVAGVAAAAIAALSIGRGYTAESSPRPLGLNNDCAENLDAGR